MHIANVEEMFLKSAAGFCKVNNRLLDSHSFFVSFESNAHDFTLLT